MSKILCFGDLHVNKEPLRILTTLNFLEYIKNYCLQHPEIKTIVNLGDTFHTSNSIRNEAFVPIFMKFMELSKIVDIITIPGNHDIQNKDNDCLAETFSAFGKFIKHAETINIDGVDYDFLGYTEDPQEIPNKGRVLFTHLEIEGYFYNPSRKIESSSFIPDMFDQYATVVSGHLHHEQHSKNFEFVGSPYPTNRGEGGKKNYFAVIDGDTVFLEEYNQGPDYITINAEDFKEDIDYTNKIVTVQLTRKVENFVKLRDILLSKGAIEINPEFIKEETNLDNEEHSVDINEGVVKSAAKFLQEVKKPDEIEEETLLTCFKMILNSVGA